jgi:hypothetical protein
MKVSGDQSPSGLLGLHCNGHSGDIGAPGDIRDFHHTAMPDATVGVDNDQQIPVLLELLAQQIAERGLVNLLFIKKNSRLLVDRDGSALGRGCWADAALGRLTGMPRHWAIDNVEIMKKTSRKNIVSIIGLDARLLGIAPFECASVFPRLFVEQQLER